MDERTSQKLLDMYILDYMIKNNMSDTAAIFAKEANVSPEPVALKSREGYLPLWWGFFSDVFSNRVSKHPEGSSSSKVSTHDRLQDSFPYNFQATQIIAENCSENMNPTMGMPGLQDSFPNICQATQINAENWSENMNPTILGMPGLQDSFPNICQATQINAENWSENMNPTILGMPGLQDSFPNICQATHINAENWSEEFLLDWRDMYDMLQNPSPATGLSGLPNHPTAMPSPDMDDSQQSTLSNDDSRPGMLNLLQSGLPMTTPRPDLNPNSFGSPSSLDTNVVEGDLSTNLIATSGHQQEHPMSPKRDHS